MTRREQGNLFGWGSVVVAAVSWFSGLLLQENWWFPGEYFFYVLMALGLFALALPIFAAWRASKLWLLMLLSPVTGYVVILAHTCG